MARITTLLDCASEDDFERVLTKYGIPVVNGGRHRCALIRGRRIPLGHAGRAPLPIGTRKSILRSLAEVGLHLLPVVIGVGLLAAWLV